MQGFYPESFTTGDSHSQMGVHGSFVGRGIHPSSCVISAPLAFVAKFLSWGLLFVIGSKRPNDKQEISEFRNTLLGLRSIHINNLTSDYWQFHQKKDRERLYGHLSGGIDMRLAAWSLSQQNYHAPFPNGEGAPCRKRFWFKRLRQFAVSNCRF